MQILFIDDDHEDFEIFCEASQIVDRDIKCIFKPNGAEGLRYLQHATQLPDYIFLDIHMPVMDGLECLKQIKLNNKLNRIPVVIFSTDIYLGNMAQYKSLGASELVTKPPTFPELVQVLRELIDRLPRPPKPPAIH